MKNIIKVIVILYIILVYSNISYSQLVNLNIDYSKYDYEYLLDKSLIKKELERAVIDNGFSLNKDKINNEDFISIFIGIANYKSSYDDTYIITCSSFAFIDLLNTEEYYFYNNIVPSILLTTISDSKEAQNVIINSLKNVIYETKVNIYGN